MERKSFFVILLILASLAVCASGVDAAASLYLCSPSPSYFSSLNIGDSCAVEIIAEADDPGVTLFVFTIAWTPAGAVEFVSPGSEGSSSLTMTGFFPLKPKKNSSIDEIIW